jgi:hypothetical protein
MNAKDKAKNLVDDMFLEMDNLSVTDEVLNDIAKQCALVVVCELIYSMSIQSTDECQYWEEVRSEIINL